VRQLEPRQFFEFLSDMFLRNGHLYELICLRTKPSITYSTGYESVVLRDRDKTMRHTILTDVFNVVILNSIQNHGWEYCCSCHPEFIFRINMAWNGELNNSIAIVAQARRVVIVGLGCCRKGAL
jgi:3-methyladenine DNA glycosylase AlkC